jgi:hypothetical protein
MNERLTNRWSQPLAVAIRAFNFIFCVCHATLDFIQVPGFPSAIRVLALTPSRRNVVQRYPWLISFSLDDCATIPDGGFSRRSLSRSWFFASILSRRIFSSLHTSQIAIPWMPPVFLWNPHFSWAVSLPQLVLR